MPYLRVKPVAAGESAASMSFVVTLDVPSLNEVRVNYTMENGTARNGADYTATSGLLTFAAGETSKTVQVTVLPDTAAESTENFWFDLFSPVNAVVEQRYTPGLIFDNDGSTGTPAISVSDPVVDESAGTAQFLVWLNKASVSPVSVPWNTADDTAQAGSDYTAGSGTLSFGPGETVKTVTVNIADDSLPELDETFRLVLGSPSGATLAEPGGVAMIGRNDGPPTGTPYVTVAPIAVNEGDTFANFVIQLSAPSTNEVRVSHTFDNNTAQNGADYSAYSSELVFAPGETTKVVQVPLLNDTTAEAAQLFWIDLYSPVNAVVEKRYTLATIFDNDATTGTPALTAGDVVVDETAQEASFFVWLNRPSVGTVTVPWSTADDTAHAGEDYAAASGTLSFAPGETVKTVSVRITDDTLPETDEFFRLVLGAPTGATLADAQGVATIGRNDTPPTSTPYVLASPLAVGEGDTVANFVVQLSAPSQNEVRVSHTFENNTALNGSDYSAYTGQLVFAPGETTKVVQVPILDNTVDEGTEGFWFDLFSPVNAVVEQRYVPGLIVDNDGTTGTPGISVGDVVVDESAQTAHFFVTLNRPSVGTVSVGWTTADDTAQAGSDYAAASGTLSFAPGEVAKTVTVNIVDDTLAEGDEYFRLLLGNPVGATLADANGSAMIGRSDTETASTPQVFASPIVVGEGDTMAYFVVQLSAPSQNVVQVSHTFENESALNGSDYSAYTGVLVFAPGETVKTVPVPLLDNTVAESAENFRLDLFSPLNAVVSQRYTEATILDNEGTGTLYSLGASNDLYTVTSGLDRIAESPRGGIDTVRASVSYALPDNVENLVLTGTAALTGGGNAGNNIFVGNSASNSFDGKEGIDTVIFAAPFAAASLGGSAALRTVSSAVDGTDTLALIERLQFKDTILASDTTADGDTYRAYAMFNAAFNRAPSVSELSLWTSQLDRSGGDLRDLAQRMIDYYAPGVPDDVLVSYLWGTLIGTPIPPDMLGYFVGLIDNGTYSQASLLEFVSLIPQNTVEIAGIVGQPLALDPAWFPPPGG
jgi:hypothetical protein